MSNIPIDYQIDVRHDKLISLKLYHELFTNQRLKALLDLNLLKKLGTFYLT